MPANQTAVKQAAARLLVDSDLFHQQVKESPHSNVGGRAFIKTTPLLSQFNKLQATMDELKILLSVK